MVFWDYEGKGPVPKKPNQIHCTGSRRINLNNNSMSSRFSGMYSCSSTCIYRYSNTCILRLNEGRYVILPAWYDAEYVAVVAANGSICCEL